MLCEYSKIFENSNNYFTIRFDSKRIQLYEIFQYLSLLYNAVFGNYNGDYGRQERNKIVNVSGAYSRLFQQLQSSKRRLYM